MSYLCTPATESLNFLFWKIKFTSLYPNCCLRNPFLTQTLILQQPIGIIYVNLFWIIIKVFHNARFDFPLLSTDNAIASWSSFSNLRTRKSWCRVRHFNFFSHKMPQFILPIVLPHILQWTDFLNSFRSMRYFRVSKCSMFPELFNESAESNERCLSEFHQQSHARSFFHFWIHVRGLFEFQENISCWRKSIDSEA